MRSRRNTRLRAAAKALGRQRSKRGEGNGKCNGNPVTGCGVERALEALAGELKIPARAVLGVYERLKKRAGAGEAAAIALFAAAKRSGAYVSLAKACELLSRCGVRVSYPSALRALLACARS